MVICKILNIKQYSHVSRVLDYMFNICHCFIHSLVFHALIIKKVIEKNVAIKLICEESNLSTSKVTVAFDPEIRIR